MQYLFSEGHLMLGRTSTCHIWFENLMTRT